MGHHLTAIVTLLFLMGGATTTSAAFVNTPTSVNATLGSNATFNCSANATTVTYDWLVNGSRLTELNNQSDISTSYDGGTHFIQLPATEEYNNTVVECEVVIRGSLSVETSDSAVLRVQGLLDAVSNLKSESLGQIIHLTWDAPPSLDITGVDLDIWYRVNISVDNISVRTYDDINIPEFNFTMDRDANTSVIYEFRVTPINDVGCGTISYFVTGYFIGLPRSITPDIVETSGSADPLNVNLTITYGNIPPGEMPDRIQIFAETIDDGNKVFYFTDDIPVTLDSDGRVLIQVNKSTPTFTPDSCSLEPHRRYRAIIAAKNQAGENNSTGNICFCTCEPQFCTASVIDGFRPKAVNISCQFTEAVGYLLILSPQTNSSQEMFIIARKVNASNSDWKISIPVNHHDNYTVFRYDLRSTGLPMSLDDSAGDKLYVPASGKENVTVTDSGESECVNRNISVIDEGNAGGSEVLLVPGTMLEVPDIAVKLCISIEPDPSGNTWVVFAHHIDDPEKLLAYFLDVTNCTTALAPGSYFFAVFVQNEDKIMKAPVTLPTIYFNTVSMTAVSPTPSVTSTPTVTDATSSSLAAIIGAVLSVLTTVAAFFIAVVLLVFVRIKAKKVSCPDHERAPVSSVVNLRDYQCTESLSQTSDKYASLALAKPLCSVPPTDTSVSYSVIEHNKEANQPTGSHYADVEALTGNPRPPPLNDNSVQYSQILSEKAHAVSVLSKEPTPPPVPIKTCHVRPLTLETLLTELHPTVTPKWQKLGELLVMDEDLVDEIFTNNETDEECIKAMLEVWLQKSLNPSWKDVTDALSKIDQLSEVATQEKEDESDLSKFGGSASRNITKPEDYQSQGLPEAAHFFVASAETPMCGYEVQLAVECTTEIIKSKDAMDSGNMIRRRTLQANQNTQEHLQLP